MIGGIKILLPVYVILVTIFAFTHAVPLTILTVLIITLAFCYLLKAAQYKGLSLFGQIAHRPGKKTESRLKQVFDYVSSFQLSILCIGIWARILQLPIGNLMFGVSLLPCIFVLGYFLYLLYILH